MQAWCRPAGPGAGSMPTRMQMGASSGLVVDVAVPHRASAAARSVAAVAARSVAALPAPPLAEHGLVAGTGRLQRGLF